MIEGTRHSLEPAVARQHFASARLPCVYYQEGFAFLKDTSLGIFRLLYIIKMTFRSP